MSLVLAHRGASGYAPENTLEAFRLAAEMGADGFELDVHVSADGELIVMHDEKVDRTTDGKGYIKDKTLKELKALDASNGKAGYRDVRIPTLREVYELISGTKLIINTEIKTDGILYPDIAEKCLALEDEMNLRGQIVYSSFNHYTCATLREMRPDAKIGLLYSGGLYNPWEYAKQLKADFLHPDIAIAAVLPDLISESIRNGVGVNFWTVNDTEKMKMCHEYGAGIITNFPDIALKLR